MRVNVYAEEMTSRIEIIAKEINGETFTGLRFFLELPASTFRYAVGASVPVNVGLLTHGSDVIQVKGPFIHHPGDDDSSAVTFWGKRDLRIVLRTALALLDSHYAESGDAFEPEEGA